MRRSVGVILAAGRSTRFGAADKLRALLEGRALASHAASAMAALPLAARGVVCGPDVAGLFDGFTRLSAPEGSGQAASLAAAVAFARAEGATDLLIALGDMPRIRTEDLAAVLAQGGAGAAAASDGVSETSRRMPPACFPASAFDGLANQAGDHGARAILKALPPERLVPLPAGRLIDVDTPEDLARLQPSIRKE